jgi:hypothetical protein
MKFATKTGLIITLIFLPLLAFGEASPITHVQPKLANPGQKMELSVKFKSNKRFGFPMTLHLVRDGKLVRLRLPEGIPDVDDLPVYNFKILAPVQTMSYSFLIEEPDKPAIISKRFTYARDCQPATESVTVPKVPEYISGEKVEPIAEKVRLLELENLTIENSINELKEIQQLLNEIKRHE